MVEVLELGPLLRRYPHSLSGGEKQRVALGRAVLSGPELLMMDEPLASLDDPLKGRILAYLQRTVAEWNIPTLFVTHSQAEVRRAAEWVVVLEQGSHRCRGAARRCVDSAAPLAWTNSAGPVNLLRIEQHRDRRGPCCRSRCRPKHLFAGRQAAGRFSVVRPIPARRRDHLSGGCRRSERCGTISAVVSAKCFPSRTRSSWPSTSVRSSGRKSLLRRPPNCSLCPAQHVVCLLKAHSLTLVPSRKLRPQCKGLGIGDWTYAIQPRQIATRAL